MQKEPMDQNSSEEKPGGGKKTFEFYEMGRPGAPGSEAPPRRDGEPVTVASRRRSESARRRERRKRILRNRIIAGGVLLALIVLIVLLVVVSTRGKGEMDASAPSAPTSFASTSAPEPEPEPDPYEGSAYYEAATPLLCNAWTPLPDAYEVDTASVGYRSNGQEIFMEERAAAAFVAMKEAAEQDSITLMPYSGHRSHQLQVNNYNASISSYMQQGHSREEAERLTQEYYAVPGTSEHEAGLAIDINSIETSFERTDAFAWLQENCTDYGFILRYPDGKQDITGIAYEPWHYRYVGINHAKVMAESGETLEEYVARLEG